MQLQELNALLTTTDQFAISPTTIDNRLPGGHDSRNKYGPTCPFGLVRATVLEVKHPWTDQTTFGCIGKTHAVERTTGVLVRIKRADIEAEGDFDKFAASSSHVEPTIDNPNVLQAVIARKAVLMPWSDYQPVRDHRRKANREGERRQARVDAAVEAIGGTHGNWHRTWDENRRTYIYKAAVATVTIPLTRAEELIEQIAALGVAS